MTMKPRAKKFRIRRNSSLAAGQAAAPAQAQTSQPAPQTPADGTANAVAAPKAPADAHDIAEIRKEGLTGRQLRMARRVAQKHGLSPISDFDAVRQLRQRGIDPFQRSNMLELVVNEQNGGAKAEDDMGAIQLPQTMPLGADQPKLPSTEVTPPRSAAEQVYAIQRDIARRRRRRSLLLLARLAAFVALPTAMTGHYFYNIATPMYATNSEFVIKQADSVMAAAGGLSSMFSGTGLATQQDSITVQSYLSSRDAMLRLDADLGYRAHFSQDFIDPLQRLDHDASREAAYKLYSKNVKLGYDPTEGILKMEVVAADPQTSAAFSEALISYAEQRVDSLTQRLREDQMAGARESYATAELNVERAQARILELQERLGVLDPTSESGAIMAQVSQFEVQMREKRLQLEQLLDNPRPNQARVEGVKGDIRRLEALIAELRSSLTETTQGADSLARISAELQIAQADLVNRQILLQQALTSMETTRIEANRQSRYLEQGVLPVAPDEPTYPRAFENTLLAMLIFGGIYLMISMTAAILREQVSA